MAMAMARGGDGITLRGGTWRVDFMHEGKRYTVGLGKNISRAAARDMWPSSAP